MLLANENGTPLEIAGRVWFVKSDMENLRDIFADLEAYPIIGVAESPPNYTSNTLAEKT